MREHIELERKNVKGRSVIIDIKIIMLTLMRGVRNK